MGSKLRPYTIYFPKGKIFMLYAMIRAKNNRLKSFARSSIFTALKCRILARLIPRACGRYIKGLVFTGICLEIYLPFLSIPYCVVFFFQSWAAFKLSSVSLKPSTTSFIGSL